MLRSATLDIRIQFLDGRFHGMPEWPPSPARLLQALLAACARGNAVPEGDVRALEWLEQLAAPAIVAPVAREGSSRVDYLPNNDLDAVGGHPSRAAEIRSAKKVNRPHLFNAHHPLVYRWQFVDQAVNREQALVVCRIARGLYQLGRGVDAAWATADLIDGLDMSHVDDALSGTIYRPGEQGTGIALACPQTGSVRSLLERHRLQMQRLAQTGKQLVFKQPTKPRFREVPYACSATQLVYELRTDDARFAVWPSNCCAELVGRLRDAAVHRLNEGLPQHKKLIERVMVGRDATDADKAQRVHIVPLPSIGHTHADRHVRRMLVAVPPNCPLSRRDIEWVFSGLRLEGDEPFMMIPAEDCSMLEHYGAVGAGARVWRTVTPVAVPWQVVNANRRATPQDGRLIGVHRQANEAGVAHPIRQAIRHLGLAGGQVEVRVQQEPFGAKGELAREFATTPRFGAARLWHAELTFPHIVKGPLILGDGRYLGLGLMEPVRTSAEGLLAFRIADGLTTSATPEVCARALRRAVMARVQNHIGQRERLPRFFTGHEDDGSPSQDFSHAHLAVAVDLPAGLLWVIAPHRLGRQMQPSQEERRYLAILDAALDGFDSLRAGAAGVLQLQHAETDSVSQRLVGQSAVWESATDYHPTRHAKRVPPDEALKHDLRQELARHFWPEPAHVEVVALAEGPRGGVVGRLRLRFAMALPGPLLLGRTRHLGGGLFLPLCN